MKWGEGGVADVKISMDEPHEEKASHGRVCATSSITRLQGAVRWTVLQKAFTNLVTIMQHYKGVMIITPSPQLRVRLMYVYFDDTDKKPSA
jgi:hypothetical protein